MSDLQIGRIEFGRLDPEATREVRRRWTLPRLGSDPAPGHELVARLEALLRRWLHLSAIIDQGSDPALSEALALVADTCAALKAGAPPPTHPVEDGATST